MESAATNTPESVSPFFSVVLTTYNRATLLQRALQSLFQQTEQDWEAIIIDDGSTDDTGVSIQPYLTDHHRLTYYKQQSLGCAPAKNAGMLLASGKYITFLDSDDEYKAGHLASRKKILIEDAGIDILHGGVSIIGNPYVPDRYDVNKLIHLNNCVIGGTFFIRRELAIALKGFNDVALGHDADLLDRAANQGAAITKTQLATYIYHRETPNSITNNLALCNPV